VQPRRHDCRGRRDLGWLLNADRADEIVAPAWNADDTDEAKRAERTRGELAFRGKIGGRREHSKRHARERHGARNRAVRFDAQRPDSLAVAGGFEPLHFRIGIRQDSQPGLRDSNLCISKSSKLRIWTVSWSPQAVQ
jgi:hypothetical protein